MNRKFYIAGKNDIACNALDYLINQFGNQKKLICITLLRILRLRILPLKPE